MDGPNWSKLVEQNRAKGLGIPWSDEEMKALHELKIPPDFVRAGCLTAEDYVQAQKDTKDDSEEGKKKSLRYKSKGELIVMAKSLGLETSDIMTRGDLILLLNEA